MFKNSSLRKIGVFPLAVAIALSTFVIAPPVAHATPVACTNNANFTMPSVSNVGTPITATTVNSGGASCTPFNVVYSWTLSTTGSKTGTGGPFTAPTVISGATSLSYTPTTALENDYVQIQMAYTKSASSASTLYHVYSTAILVWPLGVTSPDSDSVLVTYAGSPTVLTATLQGGTGNPTPVASYRWWSCSDNSNAIFDGLSTNIAGTNYPTAGTTLCQVVPGATSDTYTVGTSAEFGPYFFAEVTYTNGYGSSFNVGAILPTISGAAISGNAWEANTVTGTYSSVTGYPAPSITYQYQTSSDGGTTWTNVSGPTANPLNPTYTLTSNDRSYTSQMSMSVTISAAIGSQIATSTSTPVPTYTYPNANGGNVVTNPGAIYSPGTYEVGQTIVGHPWSIMGTPWPTLHYQWYVCATLAFASCSAESSDGNTGSSTYAGGTNSHDSGNYDFTYVVPSDAAGKYLTWSGTLTNPATDQTTPFTFAQNRIQNSGLIWAAPAISGTPDITGTPSVGKKLTAAAVTYSGTPAGKISYKWLWSATSTGTFTPIAGATSTSYTPVLGDLGNYLEVIATATNGAGHSATATSSTPVLINLAYTIPSGTTISLDTTTPVVGQMLTATVSGTSGYPTNYSYVYKWLYCPSSGTGSCFLSSTSASTTSTTSTYTYTSHEIGYYAQVQVVASNSTGSAPAVSSSRTSAIPKLAQSITFTSGSLRKGSGSTTDTLLGATSSSNLAVTYTSSDTSICTVVSTNKIHGVKIGSCIITAHQAGNGTYAAASDVAKTWSITS